MVVNNACLLVLFPAVYFLCSMLGTESRVLFVKQTLYHRAKYMCARATHTACFLAIGLPLAYEVWCLMELRLRSDVCEGSSDEVSPDLHVRGLKGYLSTNTATRGFSVNPLEGTG